MWLSISLLAGCESYQDDPYPLGTAEDREIVVYSVALNKLCYKPADGEWWCR